MHELTALDRGQVLDFEERLKLIKEHHESIEG